MQADTRRMRTNSGLDDVVAFIVTRGMLLYG